MTDPNGQAPEGQPNPPAAGQAPASPAAPARPAPVAAPETGAPAPEDTESDPRIARANKQAAEYRIKAKEAADRAAAVEAELTKLKQAAMTEDERRTAAFEAATKRATELEGATKDYESRVQSLAVENAVLRAVTNLRTAKEPLQFVDSDAVLALIDRSAVEAGADGKLLPDQIEKALRDLAKRKPYLVAQPTTPGPAASAANPARDRSGNEAVPTSLEDLKGKPIRYINAHWDTILKLQAAEKGGR